MARAGRLAERAADLDLLAQRPQRLLPPGPRPDRHRDPAGPRRGADLAAAGREQHAVDRQALPGQPRPREPDRRRQAAAPAVPDPDGGARRTARPARRSGTGPAPRQRRRASPTSPTSCWPRPATCRRWRSLAAAQLLREYVPYLRVRVVNVVDLMALLPRDDHPHGFTDEQFDELFTADTDVVFAFHGYPRAVHELLHGRVNPGRFHVRGFTEQGTTTTPFDMVVLNRMSRYHLVLEALRRSRRVPERGTSWPSYCQQMLDRHHDYVREHLRTCPRCATGPGPRDGTADGPGAQPGFVVAEGGRAGPATGHARSRVERLGTDRGRFTMTSGEMRRSARSTGAWRRRSQPSPRNCDRGRCRSTRWRTGWCTAGPDHYRPTVIDDSAARRPAGGDSAGAAAPAGRSRRHRAGPRALWPDVPARRLLRHRLPPRSAGESLAGCRCRPSSPTLGVRRYGFHGLSVQSVLQRAARPRRRR